MSVGLPWVGMRVELASKLLHKSSRPENVTDHLCVICTMPSANTPNDCCVPPFDNRAVGWPREKVVSLLNPCTYRPSSPASNVKRLATCFDHCASSPICCAGTY